MQELWLQELESLEAISQDAQTRAICLRMAAMSQAGTLGPFLNTLRHDVELDETTRGTIAELGSDEDFLLAVEDYVRRTHIEH